MSASPEQVPSEERISPIRVAKTAGRFAFGIPLRLLCRGLVHLIQILFALFFLVLHPQLKWLARSIAESTLVQRYLKPSLQGFIDHVYEPYFEFLRRLPPYWAAFSIGLPLTVLEPAKFVATILIAERPKLGIMLWLAFQGLSFILIDRTWKAVRSQARKVWLVARIHAWIWLNVSYGKYWMKTSAPYRAVQRLRKQARRMVKAWLIALVPSRRDRLAKAERRLPE
ncbi:MAG: hypothetical protein WBX25_09640 [Rhodomicrobium sp.]